MLGIKAESGTRALAVLKAWVTHMELPRGNLMAVDENNDPVEVDAWNGRMSYTCILVYSYMFCFLFLFKM